MINPSNTTINGQVTQFRTIQITLCCFENNVGQRYRGKKIPNKGIIARIHPIIPTLISTMYTINESSCPPLVEVEMRSQQMQGIKKNTAAQITFVVVRICQTHENRTDTTLLFTMVLSSEFTTSPSM
jgi:hypothetical protein